MATAPAYRYDHAAAPSRHVAPAPSVRVVPGRRHEINPTLSNSQVMAIKAIIACIVVFLIVGFIRVGLSSAAYTASSQASDLRGEIATARTTSESLAVQESLLSNPSNIRTQAEERLKMVSGKASSTITLSADPVAITSDGSLSLAGSVARLASQG